MLTHFFLYITNYGHNEVFSLVLEIRSEFAVHACVESVTVHGKNTLPINHVLFSLIINKNFITLIGFVSLMWKFFLQ
jgi:hypothetical protein